MALGKKIYIGAAARTPIGRFGGSLLGYSAAQLGTLALKECINRSPDAAPPDWVFMGHARQAGGGPNTARQATIFSGLSDSTPAITVNQACASGMAALFWGIEKILVGKASSAYCGGAESMSNTPYLLPQARWGYRLGNAKALDGMHQDGFFCPLADMLMGQTVEEYLAKELKISREAQDEYAFGSQTKANQAWQAGHFDSEVFAIAEGQPAKKFPALSRDEHLRADTDLAKLKKLKPVFDPADGSVTAGNSSGITDGAAFLHVSEQKQSHSQAEVLDYETVALDPKRMGLGPVKAIETLLKRNGLQAKDLEAVEINEAFAAQVLACQQTLQIPADKLNSWGGAIALGHPIGCTGTRITITLLSRLQGKKGALGIASLCVSGGMGTALLLSAC